MSAPYSGLSNDRDNDGIIPEQYWVQTAVMVEDIRWTSESSSRGTSCFPRSTLSCLSDSAVERQLKLVEKAGKLRSKLIKEKQTIQFY